MTVLLCAISVLLRLGARQQDHIPISQDGWQAYLAYNRARGLLALESADGLFLASTMEKRVVSLFPVGRWDEFYEFCAVSDRIQLLRFIWDQGKLVKRQTIPLVKSPGDVSSDRRPEFKGTLQSYLGRYGLRPTMPVQDSELSFGFVEFAMRHTGGITTTVYCADGQTLSDELGGSLSYVDPYAHKAIVLQLGGGATMDEPLEYLRRCGLPCAIEADKFYRVFFPPADVMK